MSAKKARGKCDGCGNSPRVLTTIDSGQQVCATCLREIRGPKRPNHLAPLEKIEELRRKGFDVSEDLTKTDCQRLELMDSIHDGGITTPLDFATDEDLNRLAKIVDLRSKGIGLSEFATACEVGILHDSWYKVRHFFAKVAGTSHRNRDGSNRQRIIRKLRPFESLGLHQEPENPVDPCAVAIRRENGEQLGYVSSDISSRFLQQAEQGYHFAVYVMQTTGGTLDKPTMGVNLLILVAEPGVDERSIAAYFNRRLSTDPEFLLETGATSVRMDPTAATNAQTKDLDGFVDVWLADDNPRS